MLAERCYNPMRMNKYIVLLAASGLILSGCSYKGWPSNSSSQPPTATPAPTLTPQEEVKGIQEQLETKTARTLPSDAEQTALRDVSGGSASGIATRKFVNGRFEFTILADLPDPAAGKYYEAWLVKGKPDETGFETISVGKLQANKGGWVLEYVGKENKPDHKGVVVTLESVSDQKPETHILEGSF